MSGKLLWLNLSLVALLAVGGVELRRRWLDAEKERQKALAVKPVAAAVASTAPPVAPNGGLSAAQYFEVAEKFLFSKDRNPVVVVEEKAPPPPPKPMPDLPNVFGVMNLGLGPMVFMSVGNTPQQSYKVGDTIGEFKLTAASTKELTFTWEDKTVTKSVDELVARSKPAAPVAQVSAAAPAAPGRPDFTPAAPIKVPDNVKPAPGADIGGERRGCLPGDSSPAGTVVDGYKKVSYQYAFGPICYWEPAR